LAVDRAASIVWKDDKVLAEALTIEIGFDKILLGKCVINIDDGEGVVQGYQGRTVGWGEVFSL
jgi:hypothetical protein